VSALPHSPFVEPLPTGPHNRFVGTLKEEARNTPASQYPAYKYYVTVGNLRLDPIIIVDS
jgi:hypothetical protein